MVLAVQARGMAFARQLDALAVPHLPVLSEIEYTEARCHYNHEASLTRSSRRV